VDPEEVELSTELEGLIKRPADEYEYEEEVGEVSELDERISPEPSPEPQEAPVSERAQEIFGSAIHDLQVEDVPAYDEPVHAEVEQPTTSLELVPAPEEPAAISASEYEAEQRRLVDDSGRPRPASPVLRLIEQTRAEREARTERVAGLFPALETTEWNVRDITYDRSRRANVSQP
jgi:hypothetical protein